MSDTLHEVNRPAWKLVYQLLKENGICTRCRSRFKDEGNLCLRCHEATIDRASKKPRVKGR